MKYAKIESGVVTNILLAIPGFIETLQGTFVQVDNTVRMGDLYDGTDFTTPVVAPEPVVVNGISVTLDKTVVAIGELITANVEVYNDTDGVRTTIINNDTYYIPALRKSDGSQGKLVKVVLTNGLGSASFSFSQAGIYTVEPDRVHPPMSPGFEITDDILIIVEES